MERFCIFNVSCNILNDTWLDVITGERGPMAQVHHTTPDIVYSLFMQDAVMLSRDGVLRWQDKFAVALPFRKLLKVVESLPLNMWIAQLHANGLLSPEVRSVRDIVLCDVDELWRQAHDEWSLRHTITGFAAAASCAKRQTTLAGFRCQAEKHVGKWSTRQKLQDIWHRYGDVLQHGFGLRCAGKHMPS